MARNPKGEFGFNAVDVIQPFKMVNVWNIDCFGHFHQLPNVDKYISSTKVGQATKCTLHN